MTALIPPSEARAIDCNRAPSSVSTSAATYVSFSFAFSRAAAIACWSQSIPITFPKRPRNRFEQIHRDAIAIFVFDRRRNEWAHRQLVQPSNSPQGLFHLPPFQGQLMFVIDVLVNAAATTSEVRATRLDPMGRSGNNVFQFRF